MNKLDLKKNLKDIATGHFTPQSLKRYFLIGYSIIGVLIILAYILYQYNYFFSGNIDSEPYSFLTSTFSFLGSWNADKNPNGWYFFSIAMWCMGLMFFPLVLYITRRIAVIDKVGAVFGMLIFYVGVGGLFLIGVFPDVNGTSDFIRGVQAGQIHNTVSILALIGLPVGLLWFGLILLRDNLPWIPKLPWTPPSGRKLFNHKRLRWPYVFLFIVIAFAATFLIAWEFLYKEWNVSHWPGEGIYSFPLWEWILILTLFFVLAWFILVLPNEIPQPIAPNESEAEST